MRLLAEEYSFSRNERWTLALFITVFAFILLTAYFPAARLGGPGICPAARWLGLACPGCGLTRAGQGLARLDFPAAFLFNPLIFLIVPFVAYRFAEIAVGGFTQKKLVGDWPRGFVNAYQYLFIAVWALLLVVRLATWVLPGLNPERIGLPP